MKKRLLLKLGLVALLGAGLFVAWLWWTEPTSGICRYTASRIKHGMTTEEVEGVIGFPPGYFDDDGHFHGRWSKPDRRFGGHEEYWQGPTGQIIVQFDLDDLRVVDCVFIPPRSFLARWLVPPKEIQ